MSIYSSFSVRKYIKKIDDTLYDLVFNADIKITPLQYKKYLSLDEQNEQNKYIIENFSFFHPYIKLTIRKAYDLKFQYIQIAMEKINSLYDKKSKLRKSDFFNPPTMRIEEYKEAFDIKKNEIELKFFQVKKEYLKDINDLEEKMAENYKNSKKPRLYLKNIFYNKYGDKFGNFHRKYKSIVSEKNLINYIKKIY